MNIYPDAILELRSQYSDINVVKKIIEAAMYDRPILIFPTARKHKVNMINSLIEHKVIKYDQDKERYEFLI